jgi:hypothetical protein
MRFAVAAGNATGILPAGPDPHLFQSGRRVETLSVMDADEIRGINSRLNWKRSVTS